MILISIMTHPLCTIPFCYMFPFIVLYFPIPSLFLYSHSDMSTALPYTLSSIYTQVDSTVMSQI